MSYLAIIRALILGLLLCTSCFGKWPYDSVGDITCDTGKPRYEPMMGWVPGLCGGSGTMIGVEADGKKGLVVSCAHVFDDGCVSAYILFPGDPKKYYLYNIHMDFERDMSLWVIADPPKIQPPAGVTKIKPEDGPFTAVGFPAYGEGGQHFDVGDFISYDNNGYEAFIDLDVHSGYSGGALFNKHGEYCGIVCGNTPLIMGKPAEFGYWHSRHTTGDAMLDMLDDYIPVIK